MPFSVYDAPEVVRGEAVDDRADVFSLGVIAYFALSGVEPFGEGVDHVPLGKRCPNAPVELTSLVDQMLSQDRDDRPSAAQIHADLVEMVIDVVEVRAAAVPMRIRKPRWTPPMSFAAVQAPKDEGIEIDLADAWVD